MGGMSAQIPIKDNLQAHEIAMGKVRADKLREVKNGHDGTWIAHPFLNNIAMEIFNQHMLGPNQVRSIRTAVSVDSNLPRSTQYHVLREDVNVSAADLVNPDVPGKVTSGGVYANVSAALAYTAAWLGGNGCIPLNHLMEDAATAEIARVQLWQWVKAGVRAKDTGDVISEEYVSKVIDQVAKELRKPEGYVEDGGHSSRGPLLEGSGRKPVARRISDQRFDGRACQEGRRKCQVAQERSLSLFYCVIVAVFVPLIVEN
jgi:malate synthase